MTDEITPELFAKLGKMAALDFDPEEAEYLRLELNHQLMAIQGLDFLAIDPNIPLAPRGVAYSDESRLPLRPDVWEPFENPEEILGQAPQSEDGYFVVPDIRHTNLD